MGQKINPKSLRTGVTKGWKARWFFASASGADQRTGSPPGGRTLVARLLEEDEMIRKVIKEKIDQAGIADIVIERTHNDVKIFIKVARPGLVIGRGGQGIEELTSTIQGALRKLRGGITDIHMSVNVEELKRSEASAQYTAQQIAWDLEKRFPFRRTMKKYLDQLVQNRDVKGARVLMKGRLGGAEIARQETLRHGALPLQTLRADIDYGRATAYTGYGTVGVKVWIYKGEIKKKRADLIKDTGERESRVLRRF